jgi:hypothetical protein
VFSCNHLFDFWFTLFNKTDMASDQGFIFCSTQLGFPILCRLCYGSCQDAFSAEKPVLNEDKGLETEIIHLAGLIHPAGPQDKQEPK